MHHKLKYFISLRLIIIAIILIQPQKLMDKFSSLFSSGSATLDIVLDPAPTKKTFKMKNAKGERIKLPIYTGNDDISGIVNVTIKDTKKYDHFGIKCTLVGYLQIFSDKNLSTQFHSLSKQLQPAGILTETKSFKFKFSNFEKEYETFNGIAGRVRYFIRATLIKTQKNLITKQLDFAVLLPDDSIEKEQEVVPMKMQVGIEECLHIDFQYNKCFYHLKDCIIGKVNFHLVKIRLKSMEICLVRKQTFGTGTTTKTQTDTLVRYEVMDGCPDRGEFIPIRMYMNGIQLAPSYKNIHNRLQVRYWINLVLLDEDERKYFKQTQITIYRKPDLTTK